MCAWRAARAKPSGEGDGACPAPARRRAGGASVPQTAASFMVIFCGTGLLSMPYALAAGGVAALAMLAGVAAVFALSAHLLCRAVELLPEGTPKTFPALGACAAGPVAPCGRQAIPTVVVAALTSAMVTEGITKEPIAGRFVYGHDASPAAVVTDGLTIFWGILLGLLGALLTYLFVQLYQYVATRDGHWPRSLPRAHERLTCARRRGRRSPWPVRGARSGFEWVLDKLSLKDRHMARIAVGTAVLVVLFILVPPIMFWGADEIQFIVAGNEQDLPVRVVRASLLSCAPRPSRVVSDARGPDLRGSLRARAPRLWCR